MKNSLAEQILAETSEETKQEVREYAENLLKLNSGIEKAIRETLVIENKQSISIAVNKILDIVFTQFKPKDENQ